MRCIGLRPGTHRVELVDRPEPRAPAPGEVLIEMLECGVCGTDRHIIAHGAPRPPAGESALVLGHEPLGTVLEVGAAVRHLTPGDLVCGTNQRSCGACRCCNAGAVDLCESAAGTGRGISGIDGYLQPRLVDDAAFCVRVPADLRAAGVLTEPLAVSEKVIASVRAVQRRVAGTPWALAGDRAGWAEGLRFLVGGAGPIGLLAGMALAAHGGEVHVVDLAPQDGPKGRAARAAGIAYHCVSHAGIEDVAAGIGRIDCAVEAVGSADVCLALWRSLGRNGALAVVGGSRGEAPPVDPGELWGRALGRNLVMVGTVASNPRHFEAALDDLSLCLQQFPDALDALITQRVPFGEAEAAFAPAGPDDIKRVVVMA